MMDRMLVEVYLPAALRGYDVWIPPNMPFWQVTYLVAQALARMCSGLYQADSASLLCERDTGEILNINMNAVQLGLKTGSRLMLV